MTDEAAPPTSSPRGWIRAATIFLISRVVVYVAMGTAMVMAHPLPFSRAAGFWDGGWYLSVVDNGYARSVPRGATAMTNIAFFPGFPLLVRWFHAASDLSSFRAALVVNLAFGVASAVGVWFLVRHYAGPDGADRAATLYSFFPGSFVLSMVYSEAVMVAFAVGCLYALIRRKWLLAGLCAAAATATRPNGLVLCVVCAVASLQAVLDRREFRSLLAPAISPLGAAAYCAYLWRHTGSATTWFRAQAGWGPGFGSAWTVRVAPGALLHPTRDLNKLVTTLCLLFVVAAAVALLRRRPPLPVWLYAAGIVGLAYFSPLTPRFVLTAFPGIVAVALWTRREWFPALVGTSAVLLAALTMISVSTLAITP